MDVKLVAKHVRGGHLTIEDLPENKRAEVESIVKTLKPLEKKTPTKREASLKNVSK